MKEYKRCVNAECLASIKSKNKVCPYCGTNQQSIFFSNEELLAALIVIDSFVKESGEVLENEERQLDILFYKLNFSVIQRREINSIKTDLKILINEIKSKDLKYFILENIYNIGYVKGQLLPKEISFIEKVCNQLGINLVDKEKLFQRYNLMEYTNSIVNSIDKNRSEKTDDEVLDVLEKTNQKLVLKSSISAGALGAIPIPYSSFFLVTPVQIAMVYEIGNSFGYKDITPDSIKELVSVVAGSIGIRGLISGTIKLVPGFGSFFGAAVGASTSFSATYAMGLVASNYFKNGRNMSQDDLVEAFKGAFEDAKKDFHEYKDHILSMQKVFEKKKKDFESESGDLSDDNKDDFLDMIEEENPPAK